MNNFILTYNPFMLVPTAGQLLNHVKVNRFIQQYYQPFAGTYLLKSGETAYVVNEGLKGFFEHNSYMLVQFDSRLASGQLAPEIWAWINFGTVPAAPALPPADYDNVLESLRLYGTRPPPPPPKS